MKLTNPLTITAFAAAMTLTSCGNKGTQQRIDRSLPREVSLLRTARSCGLRLPDVVLS